MERAPSGFCLSFEPRRGRRRRTSGRGQATSTGLELRLRSMFEPPINVFTHCVRPRVADPSGLPLACGRPDGRATTWASPGLRTPPTRSRTTHARGGDRPSSTDLELRAQLTSVDPPIRSSLVSCDIASHRPTGKRAEGFHLAPARSQESGSGRDACWPARSQAIGKHLCGRILGTSVTPAFVALRSRRLGRSGERSPSKPIVPSRPSSLPRFKPAGGRSCLLSHRLSSQHGRGVHRHAVPRTDVTVLGQRLPLRLAKRSLRRRQLGCCRNSSIQQSR